VVGDKRGGNEKLEKVGVGEGEYYRIGER